MELGSLKDIPRKSCGKVTEEGRIPLRLKQQEEIPQHLIRTLEGTSLQLQVTAGTVPVETIKRKLRNSGLFHRIQKRVPKLPRQNKSAFLNWRFKHQKCIIEDKEKCLIFG